MKKRKKSLAMLVEMEKLHERAKILFFIQYGLIFIVASVVIAVYLSSFLADTLIANEGLFWIIELVFLFAPIILAWIWAVLTYNNWGYELRKDAIYIQRGVIWKHYSSIPYERVQNIDVTRGVIARLCGFSSLMIQTAGYSGQNSPFAEGHLPALDPKKAEEYREKILKLTKNKKQGL